MKIPVRIRAFPGSDEERKDLIAAVRRHCACRPVAGSAPAVNVIKTDLCPPHELLGQESSLKRLVFYRRWHRAHQDPLS